MDTTKAYYFGSPTYGWRPRLIITQPDGKTRNTVPTEATYQRFVALANSGDYAVEIAYDENVAWTLRRRSPKTGMENHHANNL